MLEEQVNQNRTGWRLKTVGEFQISRWGYAKNDCGDIINVE